MCVIVAVEGVFKRGGLPFCRWMHLTELDSSKWRQFGLRMELYGHSNTAGTTCTPMCLLISSTLWRPINYNSKWVKQRLKQSPCRQKCPKDLCFPMDRLGAAFAPIETSPKRWHSLLSEHNQSDARPPQGRRGSPRSRGTYL